MKRTQQERLTQSQHRKRGHKNATAKTQSPQTRDLFTAQRDFTGTRELWELDRLHRNTTTKVQRQQRRDLFSSRKEVTRTQQERLTQSQQTRELFTTGKEVTRTQQQRTKSTNKGVNYNSRKEVTRKQTRELTMALKDVTGTQQQSTGALARFLFPPLTNF